MLHREGGDLSGGQQQLATAGVLVTAPSVLLLDEPTGGIQPNIVDQIGEVVAGLARTGKMAILLVEQYLDFALRHADRILVMDRGRIVLDGAADAVDPCEVRRLGISEQDDQDLSSDRIGDDDLPAVCPAPTGVLCRPLPASSPP